MSLLIQNGVLVTTEGKLQADLRVTNGVIEQMGIALNAHADDEVVDASGKLVLPGAIDAHTHLALDVGATFSRDDYYTGTRAAACGGTTTVFDFATQLTGETFTDCVLRRDAMCKPDACVDYGFHLAITDASAELLASLPACVAGGVSSFKAYMVYDFGVDDGVLFTLLEAAHKAGALLAVHAENRAMIALLSKRFLAQGKTDAWHHYLSRPELVEAEAVERAIMLSKMAGAPLYIVHLSSREAVEAVRRARQEGLPIYGETCPQYLHFTSEVYQRGDGLNFVCSPPIKGQASQDALWQALKDGTISTVATDHCPFQQQEKDWGKNDFTKTPNGCAGVETMYPYLLSEANRGRISFERAVALCATNVASIFGCSQHKGSLAVGKDADIVLYDPTREYTIHNAEMHGANDYTIWEGARLQGYPAATYCRGKLVYQDGRFVGEKGYGRFVKCGAPGVNR
ncbi:MAG: dihydropyrimidinase [Clostridia bacterium]